MSQTIANPAMPPSGFPAGQEITVVVTAMDLNVVLTALHEAPMAAKFTIPVIDKLKAYLMPAIPPRPNGASRANAEDEDVHVYRRAREA